ncbi:MULTISPECIES: ATP-binding protein [Rhodococcus]|jgi:hypothetical protein|nr:ATP-binding protein [Rhodococcus qingshengii]KLN71422.1 transcriptional regulator [Rhodococcus erythropolis]KSU61997.1 transcriptional regulator [Rhodococcus qingshengii]NHP18603.1 ATP-binding protein [Rhodococcus sp. IC4_135]SCC70396.1 Putative DNA-binding domain-containing protein [Rhodococcus qingshengii]
MDFTALHRLLGLPPQPITDEMIDAAVADGISETGDLDWKSELPPIKALPQSDFPKDIAAMANTGGGVIVYGITETQKAATGRRDVGGLTQELERALRSAAVTAISPPVFGLGIHQIGAIGNQVVAIVVDASVDGPHLIYRGEYFGAPIRNDADTVWMKERQIELMYRARFDERRNSAEALDTLYAEQAAGKVTDQHAWFIAVAQPRIPASITTRATLEQAKAMFETANRHTYTRSGVAPLGHIGRHDPHPGLRRWVASSRNRSDKDRWRTRAAFHHNGAVSIAFVIGTHSSRSAELLSNQVDSAVIENAVADFMALVRTAGEWYGTGEYETRVGIEWNGSRPLIIQSPDQWEWGPHGGDAATTGVYGPIASTVRAGAGETDYRGQVKTLAEDAVNQGGVSTLHAIEGHETH